MVQLNNVFNNANMVCIANAGQYFIYEHKRDLSVTPYDATKQYFMDQMGVRRRQALVQLNGTAVRVQAGAMQWTAGNVTMDTDIGGVTGFLGKAVKGAVTGETAVKPVYHGQGFMMLEPTYKHLLIEDVGSWGQGVVLDDGLFLASDVGVKHSIARRQNLSSAVFGNEGLFNLTLSGPGFCVLESPVPREELFEFILQDDVVKIDGNMAIAWSSTLKFTVEKSNKSLIGSGLSGEGFVNVFRGTGKILMAPTMNESMLEAYTANEPTG